MEQIKCGDVFRDKDGKFWYSCVTCSLDFVSAFSFEEHVILHYMEPCSEIEVEVVESRNSLLKIEPHLEDNDELNLHYEDSDEEEEILEQDDDDHQDEELMVLEEALDEADDDAEETEVHIDDEKVDEESDLNGLVADLMDDTESIVQCECCDQYYACNGLKQQHLHKFDDPDKACGDCPAYFDKKPLLLAHRKVHNLANTVTCPHCLEVFATKDKLQQHNVQRKPDPLMAQPKKPTKKSETTSSSSESKKTYVCDICSKEYSYLYYLKKHLKRHTENTLNHTCEVCGHEFKLRQNLTAHMRTHTGEKPFKCKLCGKAFNQPYYMTIHMRIHQKEKPYQCSLCGVSFVTSSHLGRHMKSHNNIKPHKCTLCERAFILPGHLKDHMRSQHTGERPFSCEVCGHTFSRRKLLRQHMQLHGEKRFKCKYCDLAFSQSAGRRGHEIRVHNAT